MNFERTLIEKMTYPKPSLPIFTIQSMLTLNKKNLIKKIAPVFAALGQSLIYS
jgi:hypothetical protein